MLSISYFQNLNQHNNSIEEASSKFEEFCKYNMHQPIKSFYESNDSDLNNQNEYTNMIHYIKNSGKTFLILVPSAKHLGKTLEEFSRKLFELVQTGSEVACMDENDPNILQNALNNIGFEGISKSRSSKIKESMMIKALEGKPLGRTLYGYQIGPDSRLEIIKSEATVVELIFRLYTQSEMGFRKIANHLNNERKIKFRKEKPWSALNVRDILKTVTYIGTYTRLGIRKAKMHEAIVTPEIFRKSQEITKSRKPIGRIFESKPFLLSGLIECGYCKGKMMGVTKKQSWKNKASKINQQVYRYYQCQSRNNEGTCDYHTVKEDLLEKKVFEKMKSHIKSKEILINKSSMNDLKIARDVSIKKAKIKLNKFITESATKATNITLIGEYIKEIDVAKKTLDEVSSPKYIKQATENWENWEKQPIPTKNLIIKILAKSISVEDNLEIKFTYI